MNRYTMVMAILRKDVLLFWPLAALAILLNAIDIIARGEEFRAASQLIQVVLPIASFVGMAFVIVSIIHADAPTSTQQEWLTRPIPPAVLVTAKSILIATLVLASAVLGQTITALRDDRSWFETALAATSIQWWVITEVLALCAVAVLTTTLIEVTVVIVGTLIVSVTAVPLFLWLSGTGEELYASGAAWLADQPRALFATIASGTLIGLMYSRRATRLARLLFVAAATLLIMSPLLLSWRPVFATQKRLSAEPRVAEGFELSPDGTCFSAILVDPPIDADKMRDEDERAWRVNSRPELSPELWLESSRRKAGAQAIGFETRVLTSGLPKGWRAVIERVSGAYVGPDDKPALALRPVQMTPVWRTIDATTRAASHFWLLARRDYDRLSDSAVRLSLHYAVSLLQPRTIVDLEVDGIRRYLPGIGYCDAEFDGGLSVIRVDCFKRGPEPAQLTANLVSAAPDTEVASNYPDYTPAAFEMLGGTHHRMTLTNVPRVDAARVRLTSYEARAHFDRRVTIEGLLGARTSACPAPIRNDLETES